MSPAPPTKPAFTLLQIFRGWAALLVVLYHVGHLVNTRFHSPFLSYFHMGNAGVDFFFVLSGFLISYLHLGDIGRPQLLKRYLQKRLIRIYPPYWIVTLLILPLYFLVPSYGLGDETHPLVIAKSLLLLPMEHAPILTAGWTLRNEVLFYALFAGLIAIRGRWACYALPLWAGALVGSFYLVTRSIPVLANPTLEVLLSPRNLEFLMGCGAAWLVTHVSRERAPLKREFLRWCALGLGLSCLAFALVGWLPRSLNYFVLHVAFYGILSFVIILSAVLLEGGGAIRQSWQQSPLYYGCLVLGDASYSVYLLHGPCLSLLVKVTVAAGLIARLGVVPVTVAIVVLIIGVGCGFHVLIEKPLLIRLRRWFVGERGVAAGRTSE